MTDIEIQNERVDDLPLLIGQQQKMGIAEIIDGIINPHWRRQGLSVGQTIVAWLAFILSEADHRLSYVEPWVVTHLETLKRLINPELTIQDFNDDRLGDVLRYLSDDDSWPAIERALGRHSNGSWYVYGRRQIQVRFSVVPQDRIGPLVLPAGVGEHAEVGDRQWLTDRADNAVWRSQGRRYVLDHDQTIDTSLTAIVVLDGGLELIRTSRRIVIPVSVTVSK